MFIRDLANGDLVAWIDRRLAEADDPSDRDGFSKPLNPDANSLRGSKSSKKSRLLAAARCKQLALRDSL
jgi:hypothetical protein